MISPMTPPGTHIVAIVDLSPATGLPGVSKGALYTVASIHPSIDEPNEFGVVLQEHGVGKTCATRQ